MTSLDRPLSGDMMWFDLDQEIARTGTPSHETSAAAERAGAERTARTLIKNGTLRVTLIVLKDGGHIAEHSAPGPITIHVLSGAIRLDIPEHAQRVNPGELVAANSGVRHSVTAIGDTAFLLTVALADTHG